MAQERIQRDGFVSARALRDDAARKGLFKGAEPDIWEIGTMALVRKALRKPLDSRRHRVLVATQRSLLDGTLIPVYRLAVNINPAEAHRTRAWHKRQLTSVILRMPPEVLPTPLAVELVGFVGRLFDRADAR